ncbi:cytochrome c biogenesis protein CcdC [Tumebacillus sp. ITR2]|uniref:Cytochrome c biogenesis protein CcdC n=1 Tax=Tumebacillus amylolyticus TaxID=2801339 RepID=A0ABS1JD44_9BACL|nr:cytochrome c biogenesis protein CcdC [Tumebacillus amylolyticus]MBL0388201.1 cytochrome c biogenesis protein CcdC [Tumebacillus amylolyticus]
MSNSSSSLIGLGFFVLFFGLMMWRRTAAMRRPIKGKGYGMIWPLAILLLPGVMIFANPVQPFQGSWWEILAAVGLGGILSIPMILTTQYEKRDDGLIYAKQSKAFLFAIFGVVLIRLALKEYITGLDPMTLNGLFFLTAFVYLLLWRITSFMKFRRIWRENQGS